VRRLIPFVVGSVALALLALALAACSSSTTTSSSPKAAAGSSAATHTFVVSPSGRNDTAHIQAAFNAAIKAGAGSTVQLTAGHFYTNNIFVRNFDGTFKGAGEGRTVIDTLRGNPKTPDAPGVSVLPDACSWPSLFVFKGGDIRASDMSFDITAPSPAESWNVWWNGGAAGDYLGDIVVVTGNVVSSDFEHVAFIVGAGNDPNGYYNADEDLAVCATGPADASGEPSAFWHTRGTDSVSDCSFSGEQGVEITGLTGGRATVSDNVINASALGCLLFDNSNSTVAVSHNRMSSSAGENFNLWQGFQASFGAGAPLPPLPAPQYLISDNHIVATGAAGGVSVEDDSAPQNMPARLDATIADNTIVLDNDGTVGGIDRHYAQGVKVLHNHISGTGLAAVDVGCNSHFGKSSAGSAGYWQIVGNDVSRLIASTARGGPGAQIWFGKQAKHCRVVGGSTKTTVVDQGSGNKLKNVTVMK
jgi:hypothetical protein